MKVGFIDADWRYRRKMTFPNLSIMKLSAWHKSQGDEVIWYDTPLTSGHVDKCYVSKVFSDTYTPDIDFVPDADEIVKGGSGYAIDTVDGIQHYHKQNDNDLPYEIQHIMPDYSFYGITDVAYGYMTRGCPRGCSFCHVASMQGRCSHKVADLSQFWSGQKTIKLLDPNMMACEEWRDLSQQLIDSKANVDFTQGLDLRIMTEQKWDYLKKMKLKAVHFAWDNPNDDMVPRYEDAIRHIGLTKPTSHHKYSVYILTNFNSTFQQDVYRVQTSKKYGFQPYVMIYNKPSAPERIRSLARYANNPIICWKLNSFE